MDKIKKFFEFERLNTSFKIEMVAGLTTFLSMAYIIFVNPQILSNAGMPKEALIVTTCIATALGTILAGLVIKSPIAMAPGMGLNALFTFTLVLGKKIEWQTALGIVFLSGIFFLILSLVGARERIIKAIPNAVMNAISVGIGLFIAFIGLQGLKVIAASSDTLVTLGHLAKTPVIIGLFGLFLIIALEMFKVRGSILISIIATTILGIIFGEVHLPKIAQIINADLSIAPIFLKMDVIGALKWGFIGAIFSLMFVDMFDTAGTVVACAKEANLVKEDGTIEHLSPFLVVNAGVTTIGAMLGTSNLTAYIESATGIKEGGRTGFTTLIVGLLFLLAIPFTGLISIVPGFATAPALIIVGLYMMKHVKDIDFNDIEAAFPAFLTIIIMPMTYSISNGIAFGFISYTLLKIVRGKFKEIDPVLWIVTILSIISLAVA